MGSQLAAPPPAGHLCPPSSLPGTARRAPTPSPLPQRKGTARRAPTPSRLAKARHAVPLRPLPSQRHGTPCPYALSPSQRHGTPCPYGLTPHSSLLTPTTSILTPHSYDLTPTTSLLRPHSSLLRPHPSLLRPPHPARKPDQRYRQTGYLQGVGADEIAGMCLGSCQVFPERLVLCGQMPCYGVNLCIQCQTGLFHQGVLSACGSGKRLCTLAGNASARDARFSHASSNTAPSKSHRLAASMARLAG